MASTSTHLLNLGRNFAAACLAVPQQATASPFNVTREAAAAYTDNDGGLDAVPLTNDYHNAFSDFRGSSTPCIYKSGPAWPLPGGLEAWCDREARPVYHHAIADIWLSLGKHIYLRLDELGVRWTSINPLAYADAGQAVPFCELMLSIGVIPRSLQYAAAVIAADAVKTILAEAGFATLDVAFVESVVTLSGGAKLMPFDPLLDYVPDMRKPFTSVLGLGIAPLRHPHFEGSAGLYFRMGTDCQGSTYSLSFLFLWSL